MTTQSRQQKWCPASAIKGLGFSLLLIVLLNGCESAGPYVAYDTKVLDEVQDELLKSRDAAGYRSECCCSS